jgi:hypothetical protein
MEILSKEYGWTPEEIRNQRADDIDSYLEILRVKNEIQKLKHKI